MHWDNATRTLTIGERKGEFPGMLKNRKFCVVLVSPQSAAGFEHKGKGVVVDYSGKSTEVKL